MHRAHRIAAALFAVALVGTACGSDDGGEGDGAGTATGTEAGGDGAEGGGEGAEGGGSIAFWSTENQPDRVTATEELLAGFTEASGIEVELTAVSEDELPSLIVSNAASGDLPDVVYHPVDFTAGWADQGLIDLEATNTAFEALGPDTWAEGALELVTNADGQVMALPSDGWGQLLIYRRDLFDEAGLGAPETYDAIRAAAESLHDPGNDLFGITAATDPSAVFTQQTFEHVAMANGCQLVDDSGEISLASSNCVEAIEFFADLMSNYSPGGVQDVESTRATYFAGQAAMVIWSPFILDEMAGLREDALPTCAPCQEDAAFLAKNSGFVPAFAGPSGEPAQYGQISNLAITADADAAAAQQFVEYWFDQAYVDWLAIAPEGKIPMRKGTADDPESYVSQWRELETGVDSKAPLSDFYDEETVQTLLDGTEDFSRWGFGSGAGNLVSPLYETLVVPQTLNDVLTGGLDAQAAAEEMQAAAQDAAE